MQKTRKTLLKGTLVLCAVGLLTFATDGVQAADHAEAPGSSADAPADIADFYAWHTDTTLVTAVTFAGLSAGGDPATYDADVLYTIHIDNDGDGVADIDVTCSFAASMTGAWYVSCDNVPGADGRTWGPVEETIEGGGGTMVWAGLREDPFFFDFDGFGTTLMTGDLSFDSTNDSFAGTNVTAIVVEMDRDAAAAGGTSVQTWVTTGRR